MSPYWHPLSAVLLPDPPTYATGGLIRLLLRSQEHLPIVYAGDRMWPAVTHGQELMLRPAASSCRPGTVLVAEVDGIPDVLRVHEENEKGLHLRADADPELQATVGRDAVLGELDLPGKRPGRMVAWLRRLILDHREALTRGPDDLDDLASTVLLKSDEQAPYYASSGARLADSLRELVLRSVRPGGRILVAGSGCGTECFGLAEAGWDVMGIDFSPRMVSLAVEESKRRGLDLTFHCADLTRHREPAGSLAAVLFTYDFYSFLPDPGTRRVILENIAGWLERDGCVLFSARRLGSIYSSWILTLQWLSRGAARPVRWGRSHSRWVAPDGGLHRSFIQVYRESRLAREVRAAGFEPGPWEHGHMVLGKKQDRGPAG